LDELLVLSLLRHQRELSLPEAASVLQLDRERTRQILMRMVSVGLLERSGVRKGQVFRLSGALYRELGQSVAYIRERGIDQLRHEELVLSYIRQYGHITNRQVRELLGLDKFQASRLLRSLLESGKVVRQGKSDRDAHYELPRN
jgi:ATP-dependent DNA helicase RecG